MNTRQTAQALFTELLPTAKTIGAVAFRKQFFPKLMGEVGCSMPCAATHYHFCVALLKYTDPELAKMLGPQDVTVVDVTTH